MKPSVRVLLVEDSPDDAELVEMELLRAGYQVSMVRVASADEMRDALRSDEWDVIIADYSIPAFGAIPALKLLAETHLDIPFIVVSGSISDEMAVQIMRAGAHDYVLKDNLTRLPAAIKRETQERGLRDQKRKTEIALQESENRFEAIIQSAIISVDDHQRIVLFNEAAEKVFNCPAADAIGSSLDRFIPQPFRDAHRSHLEQFGTLRSTARSMRSPGLLTAVRSDGGEFPIEATISQIQAEGRRFYTVILRDTSERKRAEEHKRELEAKLAQSQKLEAIGRLAGGVAHDFNTLLNIMSGNSELILAELPPQSPIRDRVEQIQTSAETAALLTKQLLAFSRKQALAPQVLDLNKVIQELHPMLRRLLREDIQLDIHYSDSACAVKVDPGQIHQVVLNLSANARDAMPKGGTLTIEVRSVELDDRYISEHPPMQAGKYEMVAVTDTGVGMDPDTLAHIFEPFFTTKSVGKGTGLGLATVYGIVKQSGGDIGVYSEPGLGTIFKVYLPTASEPIEVVQNEATETFDLNGTETILLVEDSKPLRELTRQLLMQRGYTVLEASNGFEALDIANSDGNVQLLMTDIVMPGMRGTELAQKVVAVRPDTAVMFLSGYTEEAVSHIPGAKRVTILEKPYTVNRLLRTVRQALDDMQSVA